MNNFFIDIDFVLTNKPLTQGEMNTPDYYTKDKN